MVIETTSLCKIYGEKTAVKDMSIAVQEGEIYGFLGPNGAGKSTTIKMLTGLVYPTSGEGRVLGLPLGDVRARMRLGYLPELFRFQDWMTGSDLLDFHSKLFRLKKDPERNRQVLSRVGLLGQEKYKVGTYSKGMQQRIGLAAALLPDPQLLLLDEPTSALDPIGRKEVREISLSLKTEGRTVLLNSHLLSEVEAVSDSITIVNKGVVVKSGRMEDMLSQGLTLTVIAKAIPDSIITKLQDQFGCTPDRQPDGLVIRMKSREDIPKITELLVTNGALIYEIKVKTDSLESIFLKTVGEGAGE